MAGATYDHTTNMVCVGAHDSYVRCLDFDSGHVVWEYKTGNYVLPGRPAFQTEERHHTVSFYSYQAVFVSWSDGNQPKLHFY